MKAQDPSLSQRDRTEYLRRYRMCGGFHLATCYPWPPWVLPCHGVSHLTPWHCKRRSAQSLRLFSRVFGCIVDTDKHHLPVVPLPCAPDLLMHLAPGEHQW